MALPFISTDSDGKPLPCAAPDCPFDRIEYPRGTRLQITMNRVPAHLRDTSPRIEEATVSSTTPNASRAYFRTRSR
jgi:hypothetical protein